MKFNDIWHRIKLEPFAVLRMIFATVLILQENTDLVSPKKKNNNKLIGKLKTNRNICRGGWRVF